MFLGFVCPFNIYDDLINAHKLLLLLFAFVISFMKSLKMMKSCIACGENIPF